MDPSVSDGSRCGERGCPGDGLDWMDFAWTESSAGTSKPVRQSNGKEEVYIRGVQFDEAIWSGLDEYLLEKIFARLPFKSLFQVATLSKSWRLRFNSHLFQSEVQRSSAGSWKAYVPLYGNHKKDLVGYELSSESWHVLPNHSYLSQYGVEGWYLRAGDESLLCWTSEAPITSGSAGSMRHSGVFHVNVTNPLTRSWRQLPPRPHMDFPELVDVACEGTDTYKVILATLRPNICVQIFDSTNGSWTTYSRESTCGLDWGGIAFIRGVLHMIVHKILIRSECTLISFGVKENIWTEIPVRFKITDGDHQGHQSKMLSAVSLSEVCVCGSNVMLVVAHTVFYRDKLSKDLWECDTISVCELDLDLGLAVEVSGSPPEMVDVAAGARATVHGHCIYIGRRDAPRPSVLYNVETQEWHSLNSAKDKVKMSFNDTHMIHWVWKSVAYRPGLNPFMEV